MSKSRPCRELDLDGSEKPNFSHGSLRDGLSHSD